MRFILSGLIVMVGIGVVPSQATVIGFVNNPSTNSSDWTAGVTGLGGTVNSNVNFNSHPTGALNSTFYLGSDGVTLTGTTGANQIANGAGPADGNITGAIIGEGLHPSSNFLVMSSPGGGTNSLIVSFATPVLGAGLFTIDRFFQAGSTNNIVIEAYAGANATGALLGSFNGVSSNFQNNNMYFMGTTSSAADILSIRLVRSNDNTGDIIGVDNILFSGGASSVPEPATMVLFGAGLAGMAVVRRLRKA